MMQYDYTTVSFAARQNYYRLTVLYAKAVLKICEWGISK